MLYNENQLERVDPELFQALQAENRRQEEHIELIASENYVSRAVLEAQGSQLTNKYAEGYPGKRYYGGCEFVDIAEQLAIDRAKALFGAEYANVQPHSGSQANQGVYVSVLKPGDTIEVHWVHSSAPVKPGPTLGSCLSDNVKNPDLRVEAQVFTLVNDPNALDFNTLGYSGKVVNGYQQADAIPANTGKPVLFAGSTTGPSYSDSTCSPLQVTWSVRPQCAKIDINSVAKWCKGNAFKEDHAHGVRKLVTVPALLSEIKDGQKH